MKIIDYQFSSTSVSNPDGSMPANAIGCTVIPGPGSIATGNYANALDFGTSGKLQVALNASAIATSKFSIRSVFKVDAAVSSRQNLIESNCLLFSMFIDKGSGSNNFSVVVSVMPKVYGWSGTSTEFFKDLKLGTWYTADLVYDVDTVAVFIDGIILSVHAYPTGLIEKFAGNQLFIGTWVDGARNHFNGKMAAVQLYSNEIPEELEKQLDERRSHAEWFLTYKQEAIKSTLNFGALKGKYSYDFNASAYVQMFNSGLIMYNESVGAAFELHGAIFQQYVNMPNKSELGYLVSDEINTKKAGGRKSIFSKGGFYWSGQTGAFPVIGQMYLDYEQFGESSLIGWPVSNSTNIANGKEQAFQGARMYYKTNSDKAFEVHGAILTKFISTGGINAWGYPVCNESDIKNGKAVLGKFNDFENCTIYWSASTGAFEVHGDLRTKYKELNGPLGQMGFPTSDEGNIPGANGRYNTFKNGSILWFGSYSNMFICESYKIFIGRINSKESEGFGMGQNDIYFTATLHDNGAQVFKKRYPGSGDYGGHNVKEINETLGHTIIANSPSRSIKLTLDIWDSDPGNDDHLGVYTKTLSMANAWGMTENNGVINSGAFSKINSITWSVKPQVDETKLSQTQKWWGVQNQKTPTLTYAEYAAAFRDVDSEPEDWDLTDWLEKAFYELVIKGLAGSGNCFGMSLEAINALKHKSIFSLPIDRFKTWSAVEDEFNVKHQYQVGASAIWWFVGQFVSGNTRDPKDVFNATRSEFARGCNPVVCIAQNWDFSGKPHCILPVAWDSSTKPWKMTICDPNFPGQLKTLFVNPDSNEFTYQGSGTYKGREWDGGRFHYMPYSMLNESPRTPIWDAILLLLAGTIIIVGSDSETESLVDDNGNDLDAFSADSISRLKQKQPLDYKFVSVKGFASLSVRDRIDVRGTGVLTRVLKPKGVIASEMYLRKEKEMPNVRVPRGEIFDPVFKGLSLNDLAADRTIASEISAITNDAGLFNLVKDRNINHLMSDKAFRQKLNPSITATLDKIVGASPLGKNFKHKLRGINAGSFVYAVKSKLNEFRMQSSTTNNESNVIETRDLGTSSSVVKMTSSTNKTVQLEITNKLGVGRDNLRIIIDKIPASVGKELNLNIKPGLAGLDILTTAENVNARVSINATINGKRFDRNFGVDIEGGIRLRPSTILTNDELKVGKIDNLFGQLRDVKMIKAL